MYGLSTFIHYPSYTNRIPKVNSGLIYGMIFGLVYRGPMFGGLYSGLCGISINRKTFIYLYVI